MKRVPVAIIQAAKQFDTEAVEFVFRHFEGFIASQCLIDCADESGNMRSCVDDDLYSKRKSRCSEPSPVFNSGSRPMILCLNIPVWQE